MRIYKFILILITFFFYKASFATVVCPTTKEIKTIFSHSYSTDIYDWPYPPMGVKMVAVDIIPKSTKNIQFVDVAVNGQASDNHSKLIRKAKEALANTNFFTKPIQIPPIMGKVICIYYSKTKALFYTPPPIIDAVVNTQ